MIGEVRVSAERTENPAREAARATHDAHFEIDPRRLVRAILGTCLTTEIGLLLFDGLVGLWGVHVLSPIRRLADLGREDSLANLVAVLQATLLALTLWAVWLTVRAAGGSRRCRRGWLLAAAFFSCMALDDGARIHERVGPSLGKVTAAWSAGEAGGILASFPSYPWQVYYLPFFGAAGLLTLAFLWRALAPRHSRTLLVAGIGCYVAALGLDFFEGLGVGHRLNPLRSLAEQAALSDLARYRFHLTAHELVDHVSKCVEETLEMVGTTLIWFAVLRHWTRALSEVRIRFTRA